MDKKELITQHAVDVIAENGYFGATPKMIAARAGIAVGTIYLYFKSKEEILDFIFAEEFTKRKKFLESLKQNEHSVYRKLELFLDFHFRELAENQNLATVLIQESTNPQMHKLAGIRRFIGELPGIFADMLLEGQQKGEVRDLDTGFTAHIIFHSIRGAVMNVNRKTSQNAYAQKKDELTLFLWQAIKK
ncbi:MAG: TetR/AcrR family transcriptional regulator [Bacillota bacterium]|nr:TetR/AcrR family transcriptional regulator [Bacillota bacterium]MDW7684864.1 TetR/AcrR family transcriptional regulator [Bacillota bacterium]